jgi:uncharacterized membrane protein
MSDIYSAPNAPLLPSDHGEYGSVEKALAGDYSLEIGAVLSEAWSRTNGYKWTFQVAFGIYFCILLAVIGAYAAIAFMGTLKDGEGSLLHTIAMELLGQMIYIVAATPAYTGLYLLALNRAIDAPVKVTELLGCYRHLVPLTATAILTGIFTILGYVALILPGIYLAVAYIFAPVLVVEKGMAVGDAIRTSRKAVSRKWLSMFLLLFILGIINVLGAIPLGIGLVWTAPMSMIALGIVYRDMFGVSNATRGTAQAAIVAL